jgi:imidazolonepropionase
MIIKNIKGLVQVRQKAPLKVAGNQMADLPVIDDAFLIIQNGIIEDFGRMEEFHEQDFANANLNQLIDAKGKYVLPAFVDSHTHLVFAAFREGEFVDKIRGLSYAEIAAKGGGILNSANRLQQMSEDELFEVSVPRAWEILSFGTAAVEIKSGYGLTTEDEIKMLRVARRIGEETPLTVKTTFLGAHAIPKEVSREDYIREVMEDMIPRVAEEGLADYIDVFCEEGFFTPEETERIVEKGKEFGLIPKIHANQLHISGGVQVGVKTGARSVDHLESIGQEEIDSLAGSDTMPTLLPGAAFYLNMSYPPAREMIQAGLPLSIATDYNPGSAPSGSMSKIISLACIKMKMTPEEAINAATLNAAFAMDVGNTHGSITRGKKGSVIITKEIPSIAFIPYAFGTNVIGEVIVDGKVIN